MENNNSIEKAVNRPVGTPHPSKPWVWTEYKPGKFDWRPVKGGAAAKTSEPAPAKSSSEPRSEEPKKEEPKKEGAPAAAPAPKKAAKPYDAPKPTIDYKTKKPADGIEVRVPDEWLVQVPGKGKEFRHRENFRRVYSDKTRMDDAKLLRILNNHDNAFETRQMAYEEARARGISEDKIDVAGTLQKKWDALKLQKEIFESKPNKQVSEEAMQSYDASALDGMDVEKFVDENFDGGADDGWKDPKNRIILQEFGGLKTPANRRRYDAFIDYMKRQDPMYENPDGVMKGLARAISHFVTSKGGSPIMVASGGAGAGKTYKFNEVADFNGMKRFDPQQHEPGDGNYHYVVVASDMDDDKDFMRLLDKHNGKLIVFDDKDKLLVSNANKIISTMKAIADGDPKMRVFEGADGKSTLFKGKILFLTNKSQDTLNADEDHKAIMSRSRVEDIHFTINENLELLADRYKTMGGSMENATPQEEADIRETLYQIVLNNKNRLDPQRFTVRKFSKMLEKVDETLKANKEIDENDAAADIFGSDKKDWRKIALQELMKGNVDNDIAKGSAEQDLMELEPEEKSQMRKRFAKNPKKAKELFGEEFVLAVMNSDDGEEAAVEETDEEVTKGFLDEISGMSIEEAESVLFG